MACPGRVESKTFPSVLGAAKKSQTNTIGLEMARSPQSVFPGASSPSHLLKNYFPVDPPVRSPLCLLSFWVPDSPNVLSLLGWKEAP